MFIQSVTAAIAPVFPPPVLYFEIYTDMKRSRAKNLLFLPPEPHISAVNRVVLSHVSVTKVKLHPLVMNIDRYISAAVPSIQLPVQELQFTHLKNLRKQFLRPDDVAVLRDMLVTMRPVAELHCHFAYMDRDFAPITTKKNMKNCILFDKQGVRLIDLLHVIEKQVAGLLRDEMMGRIDEAGRGGADPAVRRKVAQLRCPLQKAGERY
jgi:hypothetical protein